MRHAVLIVFLKELREALRDRRTLWTSLFTGPVLVPFLFVGGLTLSLQRSVSETAERTRVAVIGGARAASLVQHLREVGLGIAARDGDEAAARAWIRRAEERVVLVIPAEFATEFRAGERARVVVLSDGADATAHRDTARVQAALQSWSGTIAALRLQARGVSPAVMEPVVVDAVDVATPSSRATLLLGMLSYLALLVTLMGGMHVAIDATAGERERGTLEALLTLPRRRETLVAGKLLATMAMMTLALALVLTTLAVAMRFIPLEDVGMSANFNARVAALSFLALLPFVPLGAAGMTLVSSFTRSYREAQTWLGVVLLIPTLPIAVAGVLSIRPTLTLMAVPSLSQHLLLQSLLRDEPLHAGYWLVSGAGTLLAALLLGWCAGRLWRREALLG
ncbi:MAG: ABC transporter permease subunit [Steroidobacteraceae bacterium]